MPAASLRVISWPGDATWITDQQNAPPSIQTWLRDHAGQLANVKINPRPELRQMAGAWGDGPGADYTPGRWVHRCAANFAVSPEPGLLRFQIEQDLLSPDQPLQGYTITRMPEGFQIPADYVAPAATDPLGTRYYLDTHEGKPGVVRLDGDRRLGCAAGFGIPDKGHRAPWSMTAYGVGDMPRIPVFGFEAQAFFFFWFLRRQIDKWEHGLPPNYKPEKARLLYPTDDEKALALQENRKPRGEMVLCGDAASYWATGYTPFEPSLAIMEQMAKARDFS